MAKKQKFYVVWRGHNPGVYDNWEEAKEQTAGFPNPRFKAFESMTEAEEAFMKQPEELPAFMTRRKESEDKTPPPTSEPVKRAIAVDAACSGNPGVLEYRGVWLETNEELFRMKFPLGTNNIGEFLAIVHALSLFQKQGINDAIIYSDSQIAIGWVLAGKCRTKLQQTPLTFELLNVVKRAEAWLQNNLFRLPIVKWPTAHWGEIPADFGRK